MSLEPWQFGLLHSAPQSLGVDEATRRTVQRTIGGAESAKDMGHAGFACVMAYWESRGWVDSRHGTGWWARQAGQIDIAGRIRKTYALANELDWTDARGRVDRRRLNGFVRRMTLGRVRDLGDCEVRDLDVVIEAMKQMADRDPVGESTDDGDD